jgi:solute carrier family 25 uncoupling protein 8/9
MVHCIKTIYAEEGLRALWKGIFAGLQRQCVFAGLRIGLYGPVRDAITKNNKPGQAPSLLQRISAGMLTGAFGIMVACPTDVVKIRLQAEGRLPEGVPKKYKGSIDAYAKIVREEGVKGLYSGLGANIVRNSIMNAAELASYDTVKATFLEKFPSVRADDKRLHFICGFSAGFIAVCFASPADVTKTRLMNVKKNYFIFNIFLSFRILKLIKELLTVLLRL